MPAAHIILKYVFDALIFSGDKRLGAVLTGGPVVFMKCFVIIDAKEVSVISGKSARISMNGDRGALTTLMPEIGLEAEENRVAIPECRRRLVARSIDIPNACRKSNPKIGLDTCAIKNTNE